jgi:hypothetical protein
MPKSFQIGVVILAISLIAGAERQDVPVLKLDALRSTSRQLEEPTTVDFGSAPLLAWHPRIGADSLEPAGVLHYLEALHQVKFVWPREQQESLAKELVTVDVKNKPLLELLQAISKQCSCYFAVLPNGDILVQVKRPLEQFSE